jgi:hypothetical protein
VRPGDQDSAVREALWGMTPAFNQEHPLFDCIDSLSAIRQVEAALRYGRQYFRPISGDGVHFGISRFCGGVLAFSRILNAEEVVVVANTSTQDAWVGVVIVDLPLNRAGAVLEVIFSNMSFSPAPQRGSRPSPVVVKPAGSVEIVDERRYHARTCTRWLSLHQWRQVLQPQGSDTRARWRVYAICKRLSETMAVSVVLMVNGR